MNREPFVAGITMLASALPPRKPLEDAALELYWMGLKDLSDDEFSRAVAVASRESTFMPAPAELRAFVRGKRDLAAEAEIAWKYVRGAIDEIDYTVSEIDFGPHVNACIRQIGGWDVLCRALLEDLNVWKRKEFLRLYELFAEKPVGDIGAPLEGPEDGRGFRPRTVAIPGIPSQPQPPALAPVGASDTRGFIENLANAKALK